MRGGVARWKRGVGGSGIASAAAYAFGGACDSSAAQDVDHTSGTIAAARYAGSTVNRIVVTEDGIDIDALDVDQLQTWFGGADPETGERRGRDLTSPATDLVFDATVNAPKSFSLAAVLDPEISEAYEALQDRLRDRIVTMWQEELNARRGKGGIVREDLARIEVVELRHERSRALDAHKHRHLWLNAKVLGKDGQWSSVDSRVMLRFQNVVNAEGDLAARTDPEWAAALAAKGYTIGEDGEIEQLAAVVRPLSRRSNQIEANRAVKLAEWRAAHPGQEPDHDVLTTIDRWAWAHQRPDKPGHVDEDEWLDTVRREIADIDPAIMADQVRPPAPVASVTVADIDRDELAARAVANADSRAAGTGGRFSDFDLRAGVVRALAAAGVVANRSTLEELIKDVTARAAETATVTMLDDADMPAHVKNRMATRTASAKLDLADRFDRMTGPGEVVADDVVTEVAAAILSDGRTLDDGQSDAAGAIAGTGRLVTVTGPAGTGKTTMLRVARQLLENQKRRMVIVAPTKKAATVAGQETGATASSLHTLLYDYGFRWEDTPTGQRWTRLIPGEEDPGTDRIYEGPRKFALRDGDRVVVDEAGMVDLHTANALAAVAAETGAGIAMVGDHLQALPVGHSGAMSLMRTRSAAVVELSAVHRFMTTGENGYPVKDTAWADLSLRVREPGKDAAAIAHEVIDTGHAVIVATEADARQHMVDEWLSGHTSGQRVALVTATHDEAQTISETIQARRLTAGHLDADRPVTMQGGQVAYPGDIVQTRRNDSRTAVENRQVWMLADVTIAKNGSVTDITLASVEDAGIVRHVTPDYLADNAHLSYAATVHGVQGETTDRALVGPGVDAAGFYVGLTRGREHNAAIVVADGARSARDQLVETMQRGRIEATLDDARAAAQIDLSRSARRTNMPVRDDGRPAPWHDRTARPLGHMIHLGDVLSDAVDREKSLHEQISRVNDSIARDQDALGEINVKLATWGAHDHAIQVSDNEKVPAPLLLPAKDALLQRMTKNRNERGELSREYRQISRRLTAAQREQSIRHLLGPDVTAHEDDARRRVVRARYADEVPAWDDRKRRPFGTHSTLRAKHVATKSELEDLATERDEREGRLGAAQTMLRTGAGPDGVVLTIEQRERITALIEGATTAYDDVTERYSKMSRLLGAIDREMGLRDQLSSTSSELADRVNTVRTVLEVGVDGEGETLTDRGRERLSAELATLVAAPDRAADEERARRAARRAPAESAPAAARARGPSID